MVSYQNLIVLSKEAETRTCISSIQWIKETPPKWFDYYPIVIIFPELQSIALIVPSPPAVKIAEQSDFQSIPSIGDPWFKENFEVRHFWYPLVFTSYIWI